MNSFKAFAFAATLAITGSAFAKTTVVTTNHSESDFTNEHTEGKLSLGWKYIGLAGTGNNFQALNGQYEIFHNGFVGLNFGFNNDFDNFVILPEFRYNVINHGDHALFVEGQAGFGKTPAVKTFILNALAGVDVRLYSHLHAQAAFGIEMNFGSGVTEHVGMSQGSGFATNFGLSWLF